MLTYEQKVKYIMKDHNINRIEAIERVNFLDWVERENDFLRQYQIEFNIYLPFIYMCLLLWEDERNGIKQLYNVCLN